MRERSNVVSDVSNLPSDQGLKWSGTLAPSVIELSDRTFNTKHCQTVQFSCSAVFLVFLVFLDDSDATDGVVHHMIPSAHVLFSVPSLSIKLCLWYRRGVSIKRNNFNKWQVITNSTFQTAQQI